MGLSQTRPGSLKGLQLVVADVEAGLRRSGRADGVDVLPVRHIGRENGWADGPGGDWNSFIFFDDPDGSSWAIQQLAGEVGVRDTHQVEGQSAQPNPDRRTTRSTDDLHERSGQHHHVDDAQAYGIDSLGRHVVRRLRR